MIEDDVVAIGTAEKMYVQMIPKFKVDFEGTEVELHNITMQEKIYGAPEGMDILLGLLINSPRRGCEYRFFL